MHTNAPRSMTGLLLLLSLQLSLGCAVDEAVDVPPRVVGVEPTSATVPVTAALRVLFSETLNKKTLSADPTADNFSLLVIESSNVNDALLSDVRNPPLSDSRIEQVVRAEFSLESQRLDGTSVKDSVVVLQPLAPLSPSTAYTLLVSAEVRDQVGNPLVDTLGNKAPFRYDFVTDAGPPAVESSTLLVPGDSVVVANRRRIDVVFNQPVTGVDASSLRIDGAPLVAVEALTLSADRTRATLTLAPVSGCATLGFSTTYTLVATEAILGDGGQALVPFAETFSTSPTCDTVSLQLSDVSVIAGETDATVRFVSNKPSSTLAYYGNIGGVLDCLGGPCPATSADARIPIAGQVPAAFVHTVNLPGLVLGASYRFVVSSEDDVGSVATAAGTFATTEVAKLAINEVMANPPQGAPEPRDEYIELVNHGTTPIDLRGYAFTVDGGDAAGGETCPLPDTAPTLQPGAFVLLVGEDFVAATYGALDEPHLIRSQNAAFCAAITNSAAQAFALLDAGGRPISTMTAYADLLPHDEGVSLERTAPRAPDVAASFCASRSDVGPTPLAENGVLTRGCEAE